MIPSLAGWVSDQVTALTRPLADAVVRDALSRLRVDVTIRFRLEDEP